MPLLIKTYLLATIVMLLCSCTHIPFENWSSKSKCEKIAEISIVAGAVILTGLVMNDHITKETAYVGAIAGGFTAGGACKKKRVDLDYIYMPTEPGSNKSSNLIGAKDAPPS